MKQTCLATCAALAAIASTLTVADRAIADVSLPFEKIKIEYKPQNDKDSLIIVDPSTNPPTPVQYFKLLLQDAAQALRKIRSGRFRWHRPSPSTTPIPPG